MAPDRYDVLILGSGQGGKLLAWHLAKEGRRTAVVERQWVGGSCPAVACLPSKNEIWGARVANLARHGGQFGTMTGPVTVNMARVRARKQAMVEREIAFHLNAYKSTGAELIMGTGTFVGPKTIEVRLNDGGTRVVTGDNVIINVGSHAAIPDLPGLAAAAPITHIEALEIDKTPAHLIVLGGGYVGVEFAQAFRRFGADVTVIETGPQLLGPEDADVAQAVRQILMDEGVRILTGAKVRKVEGRSGSGVRVSVETGAGQETIDASDILVATGRVPNTAGLGLESAGIAVDDGGYLRVNDRLETSAPQVWGLGECAGSPKFTHVSVDDFRIIRDNLAGQRHSKLGRLLPYCVFVDPPFARVGLSEREARVQKLDFRLAKLPMNAVLRTEATDETFGFMKVLVDGSDDRILGFAMVGSEAGEVMAAVQMAMMGGLPYTALREAVITHLTVSEGLGPLMSNVPPLSDQSARRMKSPAAQSAQ